MTKEEAKKTLQDMWECLFNEMTNHTFEDLKEHGMLDNYSVAFDMAISALSEELSEDGTLTVHVSDGSKVTRVFVMGDNIFGGLYYPDSAENKGELISRQAVLNTLENADKFLDEERTVDKYKELLTECIKVLPSAENNR